MVIEDRRAIASGLLRDLNRAIVQRGGESIAVGSDEEDGGEEVDIEEDVEIASASEEGMSGGDEEAGVAESLQEGEEDAVGEVADIGLE
jgi:hypothetical protein